VSLSESACFRAALQTTLPIVKFHITFSADFRSFTDCNRNEDILLGGEQEVYLKTNLKRTASSDHVNRRWRNSNAKPRPSGRLMLCGWRCSEGLAASQLARHSADLFPVFHVCSTRRGNEAVPPCVRGAEKRSGRQQL
jgi:hypothetical protein